MELSCGSIIVGVRSDIPLLYTAMFATGQWLRR